MKNFRIVFLIGLLTAAHVSLAQKSQTIRMMAGEVLVEEVADSSLVLLYPSFLEAVITHTNQSTYTANLNYNILADAMQIQNRRGIQTLNPKDFSHIVLAGSTFIRHAEEGYLEVLASGKFPLYHKRRINVSAQPVVRGAYGTIDHTSSIDQASYIRTGPTGEFYLTNDSSREIEITLRYDEYYLIRKGENLVKINNQRQLLRDFSEYRNELRDFLRQENVDFSNPASLIRLVHFMETLP